MLVDILLSSLFFLCQVIIAACGFSLNETDNTKDSQVIHLWIFLLFTVLAFMSVLAI